MSRARSIAAAMLLPAAAVMGLAAHAVAAPEKSPNAEPLAVTCPSGVVAIVAAPGNGDFTPGFVVGTHQLLLPYRFTFTVTSGGQSFSEVEAKKAPVPAGAIT